jgi:hypothetical protein
MKTLLSLIMVIGLATGVAAWQQQSIDHLRQEIAQLSAQIIQTRSALDSDQARLAELKQRLRQLHVHPLSSTPGVAAADTSLLPDPESEGWWPTNKPYFYLHKDLLETVRLRDHAIKQDQLPAGTPKDAAYEIENRLFQDDHLNENMATLLGLTDAEKTAVEQTYTNLTQQVRALEAAAIQRVDPPQTDASGAVFARIPSLKSEVAPLLREAHESLESAIGTTRTELMEKQAEIFFNEHGDGLRSAPREFLRIENSGFFSVRYVFPNGGNSSKSQTYPYVPNRTDPWEYLHLFGPNGPCPIIIK